MGKWIKDMLADGETYFSKTVMYETTDYSIFKTLDGNRYIDERQINKIIKSIQNGGDLRRPITVNEKGEIIEGQHTLKARERLRLPIYFYIVPSANLDSCVAINASLTNWKMIDYVRSYAMTNQEYVKLLNFCIKNNISPSFACEIIHGSYGCGGSTTKASKSANIKGGTFSATDKEYEIAQKCLDGAGDIFNSLNCKGKIGSAFRRAVYLMMSNEKYDHKKMLRKCKAYKKEFRLMHRVSDILKEFTEVYKTNKEIVHFEDNPQIRAAAARSYDQAPKNIEILEKIKEERRKS